MIRLATPMDAEAIAEVWNAVIAQPHITFTTVPKTVEDIGHMLADRAGAVWVADGPDGITGFATFGPFRAGPGYARTAEHTVLLRADAVGRGIGRALMAALEKGAAQRGIHMLVAGIGGHNPGAVAFHGKLGFAQSGCIPRAGWKQNRWHDLIFMHKCVSPADIPDGRR